MKVFRNGRIILPEEVLAGHALFAGEKIEAIVPEAEAEILLAEGGKYAGAEVIDASGCYVAPGLVDVHCHGAGGDDTSDNQEGALRRMSRLVAKSGVTSWLPTSMTFPLDHVEKTIEHVRSAMKQSREDIGAWGGAEVLGMHMEGPFIDKEKMGAQNPEYITPPDAAFTKKHADVIRVVTIAPNVPGGLEYIEEIARDTKIACSVGHTSADYNCCKAAFNAGANHVTHLFNAQTLLVHREPGVVGASLAEKGVYTELICDTFHIHPSIFQIVCDCKKDHLVLITDSMRAGGQPDGTYDLGGQEVFVKGIRCTLADGTIAGSVLRLNEAVKNLYEHTDWPIYKAVAAASLYSACSIGAEGQKGSLEAGKDADILLTSEAFDIKKTYVRGQLVYER